ncbi:unnamed protein product [Urochloa decumbens]|uniref:GYF domain-containing protein n=1 Tax=Urochloa decumbens TaxID=240449 RepID=A0ABC8YMP6_9POAL
MAERKLDRPAALGKDGLSLGIEEDRAAAAAMGFVDDSKDQLHLDNSIPLSPQWLYAKPADGKISLPHGSSFEPAEREVRMLEGIADRKERRRNVFDADSGLRWLEEERETSLLGRRERKKEVERDVDNRKIDRRSDNVSARDNTDSRAPPTSDRRNDGSTRTLGNEGRRDGKWSTRWGPDDKEKDSRSEKRVEAEKDETYAEKQTFTVRQLSESDSRDKWRPRHRQESHPVGTATYRAAPGFGSEKGRVKDSNVGFAPGRGRGNPNSVTSFSRPSSAGPIGAPAVHGKSAKTAVSFRYPRGKLLDIYRQKNMTSSFDDAKLEEIPSITLSTSTKPLAFVAPDTVEEALLEDIRKGKVISSEGSNAIGNKKERSKELEELVSGIDDDKDKVSLAFGGLGQEGSSGLISEKDAFYDNRTLSSGAGTSPPKRSVEEIAGSNQYGVAGIQEGLKTDEAKSSADPDLSAKLPDDSNTLFDVPPFEHHSEPPTTYQSSDLEIKGGGHASYPEELTLYYLDPQGGVQGPFLGADIISWYEDGYFGLELPVRLSQAPDDVPFRPLVEIMPHLGQKPQSHPPALCDKSAESFDSSQSKFEAAIPTSASSGKSDKASKWDSESNAVDPKRADHEASLPSRTGWSSSPESGKDIGKISNRQQHIPESVTLDAEEVLYTGRPNSSMGQSIRDLESDRADFQLASRDPHSAVGEANLPQHDVTRESDLSPLGLLWSELEGMHPKQPLSSNVLGVNERRNPKPTAPKDIPPVNMRHGQLSRMNEASSMRDEWAANFGRLDSMNDANIPGRIPQVEAEHHLNFEEQLLLQQIRREQLQQEQMMARNNLEFPGPFPGQVFDSLHQHRQPMNQPLSDVEHLLRVQYELDQQQQRRQQLQQEQHQRQLQQQRQAQLLQQQQQQQQQQMILEQLLQQQLQGSNFGPTNMVDQVLLREHVLNELHQQPHHLQRQHDAAIEQLIQAKFGHGLHREHHNDMLDALSRSNQRQMLPLEQQILLGLQHEQLQSQQLANALRQHSGREEERHLSGVWPMDDAAQFIRPGTSPNQGHASRHGRFDILENLHRSSSFEQHEPLDRSLSLHERLHRGGQGIHSLERSGSLPGGGPAPNPDVMNALARHHGLGQLETHGDLFSLGQMPMLPSGVHPQQHRLQEQLPGSHLGRLERQWSDANGQLQMESSRINQLQIEAEKQRRNVEMNLSVDNPHAWAALMNKERNAEQDLSDMIHKKLILQSQQSLGFPDVPVPASFGRKDHFAHPIVENPLRSPVDRMSFEESLAERSLFAKTGQSAQEGSANLDGLTNNIENSGKYNLRSSSGSMLEQKHFLGIDDGQRDFSDITGGRASANHLVGSVNELARGKKQGSSANLAGDDTNFSEEAVSNWSDSGISKGSSHSLLKRSTNQHTATSQAVSTDLSTIRLKKAGLASSDENKMESGVSVTQAMEVSVPSNKDSGVYSMPSATNNSDASGPSFSEALKSKKPPLQYDTSESADGAGGKGAKKKAKKGKQIDPSLLGFKVHSNRIMMGEIVRDD